MPNYKNIPHKYFVGGIIALVVILGLINVLQPANFLFKDKTDYAQRVLEAEAQRRQYRALLAAIDVSPKDSETVLKKIATEEVVKEEVYNTLRVNQKITVPEILDSELAIAPRGDKKAVEDYLQKTVAMTQNYNARTGVVNQIVFSDLHDKPTVAQAVAETHRLVQDLRGTQVPPDMVQYHKAKIIAYQQYADFLNIAESYDPTERAIVAPRGAADPGPKIYRDFVIINNRAAVIDSELRRVDQKYALSQSGFRLAVESAEPSSPLLARLGLVKESQAFLGFGDLTITIGDIPRLILYGVEQGLAKAFTQIIMGAVDRIVEKIDKYFTITSQLYYSQELGKLYTKEYWTKFNVAEADQQIMKNFLPEYFCAPKSQQELQNLTNVFRAKSQELLKYDISSVPFESANYYDALNDLGQNSAALVDPWSYWKSHYTAQAGPAGVAAADAVNKEITGSGLKSGRDLLSGAISQNVEKILNVQEGSVTQALNLGNSNADNIVSTLVSGVFESVTTKFIFTAVSTGQRGGGLGIVEEQPLCIGTPKFKPVVPSEMSEEDATTVTQAELDSCRVYLQLYDEAVAAGATGLNKEVADQCRAKLQQAGTGGG